MRLQPFAHCLVTGNVLADLWKTYEDGGPGGGPRRTAPTGSSPARSSWPTRRAEAPQLARTNSLGQNYQYIGRLFDKGLGRRIYKRDLAMSDADCNLDYLMGEQIIAGDLDDVLRGCCSMVEETGPFGTLVLMSYDWDDKASWLRSMELFASELMPALNKALCGTDNSERPRCDSVKSEARMTKEALSTKH